MKQRNKTQEELSKVKINNLPNKEIKVRIIKMLNKLGRRMHEQSEEINRGLENTKKNQTKLKNTITEIKNTLNGINIRLNDTEGQISKLEDRVVEITRSLQKKEKRI